MNMPKRARVLIDIQNDYLPGGKWTLSGIESHQKQKAPRHLLTAAEMR
jgi:hypothetical protein